MKKLLLPLVALFVFVGFVNAQDAAEAFKNAKKLYGNVATTSITDPEKGETNLEEARRNIDIACASPDAIGAKNLYKLWETKTAIYNDIAKNNISKKVLDENFEITLDLNPATEAFSAIKEGMKVAEKKWQKKEFVKHLLVTANYLSNFGSIYYGNKNYKESFKSFEQSLKARKVLNDNDNTDFLTSDEDYYGQMFSLAICADAAGEQEAGAQYYQQLYDRQHKEPAVYSGMYRNLSKTDEEKALAVLAKGRELFPDDQQLLVAEINHYLKSGKLQDLIGKLKEGFEKDPSNYSYVTTLGQVYDQLSAQELEAGNAAKSDEYCELALNSYQEVVTSEPGNHDALYSIGAVYYNKAALLTKDLATLENDFSKAGTVKYNAKKDEITAMFDKALPYFQKAEKVAPSDMNTLIALKEVYARKNDLPTSNEFKARIEKINNGEAIEASYFDK